MSNQEAYNIDLDELADALQKLLAAVPVGKTKSEIAAREKAEHVEGSARALIGCMKNDYRIIDC